MNVVVIGGGLAGLSSAWYLQKAGHTVRVLDPNPGGKARTLQPQPGWTIEWGPHSFTGHAEPLWKLCKALDLSPVQLGKTASSRYLRRQGQLVKAGPRALSLRELWQLARGLFRQIDHSPEESIGEWVEKQFGRDLAQGPIAAMLKGIWASDPDSIEMRAGFPNLFASIRQYKTPFAAMRKGGNRIGGTWTLQGGMGSLTTALAQALPIEKESVSKLIFEHEKYCVYTPKGKQRYDAAVIATEAPVAATLIENLAPSTAWALRQVRYAPLAVAHWMSENAALPTGFGWLSAENTPILGTIFVSDIFPNRCPAGSRSFVSMMGGSPNPAVAEWDAQMLQRSIEEEHRQLTGKSVHLSGFHVVRHPAAVALPSPGHAGRVTAMKANLPKGLALAGSYLGSGAMPDAIAAGEQAAQDLLRNMHVA